MAQFFVRFSAVEPLCIVFCWCCGT